MIRYLSKYFASVPPVFIDGLLYVLLAITAVNATMLGSEKAAEFINPQVHFYALWLNGVVDAGVLALKMFRSTAFSEHREEKKRTGNTAFFGNPNPPGTP